jgi:hypothetical protein
MSEITLEAIEQLLDKKLDDKFDEKLKPIRADLSGLKADFTGIRTGMALLATSEELSTVSTRLTVIVKDTSNWNTEMTVMRERMNRYEDALKLVGEMLNLDLQTLLH